MTAVSDTPTNINMLSPFNFTFELKRSPHLNFFIQSLNIPGLALPFATYPNPFTDIKMAGDHIQFNELNVTFKIDEELKNYLEIFNWIRALGFPEEYEQHTTIANSSKTSGNWIKSDIAIMILNSSKIPKFAVNIHDAFPILLSDLRFDTRDVTLKHIDCSVTFKYTNFTIETL